MNLETLLSDSIFYRNSYLRIILLKIYHIIIFSPLFWFRKGPKLLINGVPKSGTHLLTSVLNEIPFLVNTRYGISMWDINRVSMKNSYFEDWNPSMHKFEKKLSKINGHQFMLSHLPYHKILYKALKKNNIKMININRSSDDVLQSKYNYINTLDRHFAHKTLKTFKGKSQKINALKNGFKTEDGYILEKHETVYGAFEPWKNYNDNFILNINFEELAGEKKGFSDKLRKNSILKILNFLNIESNEYLIDRIHNKASKTKSFTLRNFKN